MGLRSKTREFAVQALYSYSINYDINEQDPSIVLNEEEIYNDILKEYNVNGKMEEFFNELFFKTVKNIRKIDVIIKDYSQNWDFERIALTDKCILRLAIAEFYYFDSIPSNVTIDEAVELTKKFSTDKSGGFVNGILDSIKNKEKIK